MFLSRVFTLYPDYFPGYLDKGLFGKSKGKRMEFRNYKYKRLCFGQT